MTIGEFSRASGLSAKALRLYGELELLPPARVDPFNGYRFYGAGQLERARLVGRLRGIGMPLARIQSLCALPPAAAAAEVAAFRDRIRSESAERERLASLLVDDLTAKARTMARNGNEGTDRTAARADGTANPRDGGRAGGRAERCRDGREDGRPLWRSAVRLEQGPVRERQEDAVLVDGRLLAVADGFGPRGAGARAAEIVVEALSASALAPDPLRGLEEAVRRAAASLRAAVRDDPALAGLGSTLTALTDAGRPGELGLVHIGDSRAYLLRDGELRCLTQDHSRVRALVEGGAIEEFEAATHPQRALLVRAIQELGDPRPDLATVTVQPGDRLLLCTDGLWSMLTRERIAEVLAGQADPVDAVRLLSEEVLAEGSPDNMACVVADVLAESTTPATPTAADIPVLTPWA